MKPTALRRWKRRSEARPGELVDAALALFSRRGFAATRLEDVAARAGVSKGTVYLYFESKEQLFEREAVDIIAPDFQKVGGLLEGRRIADMADVHYLTVAPHNISGPIGTMAAVHLSAAIPNFLALEWHAASVPFFDDLFTGGRGPMIDKGYIKVPDKPGLGIEFNERVAYKYRKPGEAFFDQPA